MTTEEVSLFEVVDNPTSSEGTVLTDKILSDAIEHIKRGCGSCDNHPGIAAIAWAVDEDGRALYRLCYSCFLKGKRKRESYPSDGIDA